MSSLAFDLAAMRAYDERYHQARMLSSTVNNPLPIGRPTPVLRFEPKECDMRLPAPSRDPCPWCNIRGDIGCEHQAAFVAGEAPVDRLDVQGKRIFARRGRQRVNGGGA